MISFAVISVAMITPSFSHAGALSDIVGNYLVGRQINNSSDPGKTAVIKSVIQTFGDVEPSRPRFRGIELDTDWSELYKMAQETTQTIDQNLINAGQKFEFCATPNILRQLNENPKTFEFHFNSKLPKQASNPSVVFDYGTVRELSRYNQKFTGLEPVAFPNPDAINTVLGLNSGGNVMQNSSAIMLPKELATEIKKQYSMLARNPGLDGRDMYVATMRDIATIGYLILKNPQLNISFDDFFINSMLVYTRNKVLCVYDAPLNY